MKLEIEIKDLSDVRLLSACINSMQQQIIQQDMNYTIASLKIEGSAVEKMFKEWQEETLTEWHGLQQIKKQLDDKIKLGGE